jgi:hypothetical protein
LEQGFSADIDVVDRYILLIAELADLLLAARQHGRSDWQLAIYRYGRLMNALWLQVTGESKPKKLGKIEEYALDDVINEDPRDIAQILRKFQAGVRRITQGAPDKGEKSAT